MVRMIPDPHNHRGEPLIRPEQRRQKFDDSSEDRERKTIKQKRQQKNPRTGLAVVISLLMWSSSANAGKPLLEVWYASWCPHCVRFERDYRDQEPFRRWLNDRYAIVMRDYDRDRQRAHQSGVQSLPAFCVDDQCFIGYLSAQQLAARLDSLSRRVTSPAADSGPSRLPAPSRSSGSAENMSLTPLVKAIGRLQQQQEVLFSEQRELTQQTHSHQQYLADQLKQIPQSAAAHIEQTVSHIQTNSSTEINAAIERSHGGLIAEVRAVGKSLINAVGHTTPKNTKGHTLSGWLPVLLSGSGIVAGGGVGGLVVLGLSLLRARRRMQAARDPPGGSYTPPGEPQLSAPVATACENCEELRLQLRKAGQEIFQLHQHQKASSQTSESSRAEIDQLKHENTRLQQQLNDLPTEYLTEQRDDWRKAILKSFRAYARSSPSSVSVLQFLESQMEQYMGGIKLVQSKDDEYL